MSAMGGSCIEASAASALGLHSRYSSMTCAGVHSLRDTSISSAVASASPVAPSGTDDGSATWWKTEAMCANTSCTRQPAESLAAAHSSPVSPAARSSARATSAVSASIACLVMTPPRHSNRTLQSAWP